MPLSRSDLVAALDAALRPDDRIRAAWLAGSAAFDRLDDLSDIDLMLLVRDDAVEDVITLVDAALAAVSPLTHRFRMPQPLFHGHEQVFYQLANAPPTLLVDVLFMALSKTNRFLEVERHGTPIVLFDRDDLVVTAPLDRTDHEARIRARLLALRQKFSLFQVFVTKAIARQHAPEAAHFYHNLTLLPLVELLRIRHCPDRFDYGLRYIHADLPAELAATVSRLSIHGSLAGMARAQEEAIRLFEATSADPELARYAEV